MTVPAEVRPDIRDRDYTERATLLAPLRAALASRGLRWGHARAWALEEVAAGRRPWRLADIPRETPNPVVLQAFLDHLERCGA